MRCEGPDSAENYLVVLSRRGCGRPCDHAATVPGFFRKVPWQAEVALRRAFLASFCGLFRTPSSRTWVSFIQPSSTHSCAWSRGPWGARVAGSCTPNHWHLCACADARISYACPRLLSRTGSLGVPSSASSGWWSSVETWLRLWRSGIAQPWRSCNGAQTSRRRELPSRVKSVTPCSSWCLTLVADGIQILDAGLRRTATAIDVPLLVQHEFQQCMHAERDLDERDLEVPQIQFPVRRCEHSSCSTETGTHSASCAENGRIPQDCSWNDCWRVRCRATTEVDCPDSAETLEVP